jgi:2'-5' RNA ligase
MKQTIVIFLKINKEIELIRKRYEPNYKKFRPHITLVYPFKVKDQRELNEHIGESVNGVKSFNLSLSGIKKSAKGYYLYLLVEKGKSKIIKLYTKMNRGILKGFKNKDMPRYIPHITLGVFRSKKDIDNVIKELKNNKLDFSTKVNAVCLLTVDGNHFIKKIKSFKLRI